MNQSVYGQLAKRLDALPNGFPTTNSGIELELLARLFTIPEAELVSHLKLVFETPAQIASRCGLNVDEIKPLLKQLARRGLINAGRTDEGLGFSIMPFVVGFYETQIGSIDAEFAQLFEEYYQEAFSQILSVQPPVHRVIPIGESIRQGMEIQPYENAIDIIEQAQSWGVLDCICRVQKRLVSDPCEHPIDVCLAMSIKPGAFDHSTVINAVTKEDAVGTLTRAAEAGLVHSVSNNQQGNFYVCSCCTCSCGILRGMSEMGIANVVARSAFVNQVEDRLCIGCEDCMDGCQFDALSLSGDVMQVDDVRCFGCGVCILLCQEGALGLVRRPEEDVLAVPENEAAWRLERAQTRGHDLDIFL